MKTILQKIGILAIAACSLQEMNAQTVANGGMEEWVSITSTISLERPANWWGFDQVLYNVSPVMSAAGFTYVPRKQLKKSEDKCSGDYAARLITHDYEGVLGLVPGIMANGELEIDLEAAMDALTPGTTGIEDFTSLMNVIGGEPTMGNKVDSVTACVLAPAYNDENSAVMIRAMKHMEIGGVDTLVQIGSGMVQIVPDSNFQNIMVPMVYVDPGLTSTDTLQIIFLSSYVEDTAIGITIENRIFVDEVAMHLSEVSGISDKGLANSFSIFPNPSRGFINIQNNNNIAGCTFGLYDMNGRLVVKQALKAGAQQINIEQFPAGNFLYRIENSNGLNQSGIIAVQK